MNRQNLLFSIAAGSISFIFCFRLNFCVSLLRKIKKRYYENLNEKFVVDNKLFWKTIKLLLSDNIAGKD